MIRQLPQEARLNSLYSFIPLMCIIADAAISLFFLSHLPTAKTNVELLGSVWVGLQVIFSVVFGIISDKYCRKKTLAFTIICSVIALVALKLNYFWIAIFIDGIFGNIIPVARATYCDIHTLSARVPNIINTFIVLPIPYIVLSISHHIYADHLFTSVLSFSVLSVVLVVFLLKDFRDKDRRKANFIILKIKSTHFYKLKYLRVVLALLVWNSAWYIILYYNEQTMTELQLEKTFLLIVGLAFFVGTVVGRIYRFRVHLAITVSLLSSFLLLFTDWIAFVVLATPQIIPVSFFLQFTMLGGVGLPYIFSYFGEIAKIHEQGEVFGFLESIVSLAEFIGPFFLVLIKIDGGLNYYYILPFLFVSALLSLRLNNKVDHNRIKNNTEAS
ncbi:MAG: MFS transporter [Chlamydiales bacterium]|nr:MFS transporter [Chlamydiales bacterium]